MFRTAVGGPLMLVLTLSAAADAQQPPQTDLGVTRIALFSSGVGYFECDATVSGTASAQLDFRAEQINDIIKSMVVQDYGGGRIGVISYASRDPIERTLKSFAVDLTGRPSLGDLLNQLRGEPVETTGPRTLRGVIVGVEVRQVLGPDGKVLQEIQLLTILTEAGLERIELDKIQSIRLTNEKIDAELRKALATLATGHDADKKSVRLAFEGTGDRKVRVAYLLEAPIWKTSYRLVLGDEDAADPTEPERQRAGQPTEPERQRAGQPTEPERQRAGREADPPARTAAKGGVRDSGTFLQGWATVDNATENDWNNVRLSLVSGRPISFRMDLYTPLYVPRPLETLDLYASLRPPTYEGGFEARDEVDVAHGKMVARREMLQSAGGRGPALAAPAPPAAAPGTLSQIAVSEFDVTQGIGPIESIATAAEAGELFAYHIDTPVSIARQHSAMLPIVNKDVDAKKVSIFNPATHPKHPLNGLELRNTTGLHLMQGPVTVFDGSVYAGEAKLPDIKPDEQRFVAYALDLSTEVLTKAQGVPEDVVSFRIAKGTLLRRNKLVDSRTYEIKNKADKPRTVIVEQPFSDEWKLVEPKEAFERTQNLLRFKVAAAAQKTTPLTVTLERVYDQSIALMSVGLDEIRIYLRSKVISPGVKEALEKVVALRSELDGLATRRAALEKQQAEAVGEQARIRENLKTLDKSTDAYQRQLKSFDETDARILTLNKDIAAAREQEQKKRQELEQYLVSLTIE